MITPLAGPQHLTISQHSTLTITTALTLRLLFRLPLRQTEGFLQSRFGMRRIDFSARDHTTLSRRGQSLDLTLRRVLAGAGIPLVDDSSETFTAGCETADGATARGVIA